MTYKFFGSAVSRGRGALNLARAFISMALSIGLSSPGVAHSDSLQEQSANYWQAAATVDVQAAHELLLSDHPGAAPEVHDTGFVQALHSAYRIALHRALEVDSLDGYTAVLEGFADAFNDSHLRSNSKYQRSSLRWAGLIMTKRGVHWIVAGSRQGASEAALTGAELISCDGRSPDEIGKQSLGQFRYNWNVEAERIRAAPWLLIDDGNPFVTWPRSCTFSQSGQTRTLTLRWRALNRDIVNDFVSNVSTFGEAGYGVSQLGGGYLIAVQMFTGNAVPVIQQVAFQAEQIRKAPYVILDLRGNEGGTSTYGDQIAEALLGSSYVTSVIDASESSCEEEVMRVSDGNISGMSRELAAYGPNMGPVFVKNVQDGIKTMKDAKAHGHPFTASVRCSPRHRTQAAPPPPLFRGKMYVLTDGACFSSCLSVVNDWRRLGAIQIGQPTDASTHYTDVIDVDLPSGMATFSTLSAVSPGDPMIAGPFIPRYTYDGSMRATTDVLRWTLDIAQGKGLRQN